MTHEVIKHLLDDYVTGELTEDARGPVADHIAACGICAAEVESLNMILAEFHNGLRLLRSIDLHELQAVGLWTEAHPKTETREAGYAWNRWLSFQEQPHDFFIRCDDETAAKIWAAMEKRMKPK